MTDDLNTLEADDDPQQEAACQRQNALGHRLRNLDAAAQHAVSVVAWPYLSDARVSAAVVRINDLLKRARQSWQWQEPLDRIEIIANQVEAAFTDLRAALQSLGVHHVDRFFDPEFPFGRLSPPKDTLQ